ncbi:hypothetical protein BGZ61DRAFT_537011 [Ilyonectria robusta]|uniref:uncharacterized protein n=1 Tax=Ilyonectria robusta TaxID=1079257 RepID=UPI001E8D1161|nr:uncharacterized protein BGZ61DRAFT_537011 [Ilyonectria robusta]KAH8672376.1 hypothetical protein BGZ61DRAFT_537011 [Ilyonectria robusta]
MVVLGGTQPDFIPAKNCKKAAEAPNAFASEDIPLLFSLSLGVYRMFDISVAANVTITDDNLTEDLVTQVTALSLSNQDQATKNTTTRAYIYHDLLRSNITALSASDNGSSSCDMINAECYEHIKERFGGPQDNGCRFHGFPEACSEYMSQNLVQNGSFWVVEILTDTGGILDFFTYGTDGTREGTEEAFQEAEEALSCTWPVILSRSNSSTGDSFLADMFCITPLRTEKEESFAVGIMRPSLFAFIVALSMTLVTASR